MEVVAAEINKAEAERLRSTYLIEDPEGGIACGLRLSSIYLPSKTASTILPESIATGVRVHD